jgi:hypothetical protein
LESLQRGNFFLIPLDDRRDWYRYHHLFADVLHMHLMMEQPDQVMALHRRASEWYEQNGSPEDAVRRDPARERDGAPPLDDARLRDWTRRRHTGPDPLRRGIDTRLA